MNYHVTNIKSHRYFSYLCTALLLEILFLESIFQWQLIPGSSVQIMKHIQWLWRGVVTCQRSGTSPKLSHLAERKLAQTERNNTEKFKRTGLPWNGNHWNDNGYSQPSFSLPSTAKLLSVKINRFYFIFFKAHLPGKYVFTLCLWEQKWCAIFRDKGTSAVCHHMKLSKRLWGWKK